MAIKTYKKSDGNKKLSTNFMVSEFLCHGTGCCSSGQIDDKLVDILQSIRDHFGKPVHITSAYRCATWNKKVGGVSRSYHCSGQAADIKVDNVAPAEVAKYAESIGVLGIGLYETNADGYFVHVDTRTTKSYWYGQAQKKRDTFGGAKPAEAKPVETKPVTYTLELRNMTRGMSGEDVRALQILLNGRGYDCGSPDSEFGAKTEKAVSECQKANKLTVDKIAGKATMSCLIGIK